MSAPPAALAHPEHNVTGIDYSDRAHFRYAGPLIDIHAHVMVTRPDDPKTGPPTGTGPGASTSQAETMLAVAREFGIVRTYSMCLPDDIPALRERCGAALGFNGSIVKKTLDEPDEAAYRLLDRFLELGVEMIKFWSAPRGRERGLFVDAPWRIEAARRARAAGVRIIMVHVADPDVWFRTMYADAAKYGTKADQYTGLERMLQEFPDVTWIGAHMGGDPEHPDHLEALLETLSPLLPGHQRHQVAGARGVGPAASDSRPDLSLSRALSVRLGPRHAPRPRPRALRQPLLVPANPVGKRLARPQSHRGSRLHARTRRATDAAFGGSGVAARRAGKGLRGQRPPGPGDWRGVTERRLARGPCWNGRSFRGGGKTDVVALHGYNKSQRRFVGG